MSQERQSGQFDKASKEDAMQSSNPVFSRAEGFNGRSNGSGNETYPGNGQQQRRLHRPLAVGHRAPAAGPASRSTRAG